MFSFFKKKTSPQEVLQDQSYPSDDSFDDPREIFERFTNITGMNFSSKEEITKQKIQNFCMRYEIGGFGELNTRLEEDDSLLQALIDYLTVNETYFFRELEQIEILKEQLKAEPRPIRILCAPCATGEEVYSIIIQFLEAGIPEGNIHVIGIDINASAIQRAKTGVFSQRSVSRIEPALITRYFTQENNSYKVTDTVHRLADFRRENIFDETFRKLGMFDVIFSRNLFIYFNDREKKRAVEIFCSLLKPGGQMFFGHADNFDDPVCLKSDFVGRTRVYRKI